MSENILKRFLIDKSSYNMSEAEASFLYKYMIERM